MLKIFLSSHGHLASGMESSLKILTGNTDKLTVFDAYVDESTVQEHLDQFYQNVKDDDQVLLLSDLYGGSVNQAMYLYLEKPNTYLIAGVNLALVLELMMLDSIDKESLNHLIDESRKMLTLVELDHSSIEEEEFF